MGVGLGERGQVPEGPKVLSGLECADPKKEALLFSVGGQTDRQGVRVFPSPDSESMQALAGLGRRVSPEPLGD